MGFYHKEAVLFSELLLEMEYHALGFNELGPPRIILRVRVTSAWRKVVGKLATLSFASENWGMVV